MGFSTASVHDCMWKKKACVVLCTEAESGSSAVQSKKLVCELLLMTENDGKKCLDFM